MSFSAHSAFLCDRLLNMFCSAAYKLAPPFGHIKVELCPGLEPNSWTKSANPRCLCGIILFVLLYHNHLSSSQFRLLSCWFLLAGIISQRYCLHLRGEYTAAATIFLLSRFPVFRRAGLHFNSRRNLRASRHYVLISICL